MITTPSLCDYIYDLKVKFSWIDIDKQYIDSTTSMEYTFFRLTENNVDMLSDIDYFLKVMLIIGPLSKESFDANNFCISFKSKNDMMLAKLRLN